nr:hypothetical protein B0A51_04351 [Rachicladosporium sp. CCFEE 5018]
MAATKRKHSATLSNGAHSNGATPPLKRRASARKASTAAALNPEEREDIFDAPGATRASPDNVPNGDIVSGLLPNSNGLKEESPLSDAPDLVEARKPKRQRAKKVAKTTAADVIAAESAVAAVVDAAEAKTPLKKARGKKKEPKVEEETDAASIISATPVKKVAKKVSNEDGPGDPEADGDEDADPEELKAALARPPAVNSSYLPLPWKGRLGYACLNTYLRASNPPIFSSRTCRIQSILEHRHPLQHPDEPEHATKNRPDRTLPADEARGHKYVQEICLANVRDIEKMIRWNDKYHIRFLRLSSEMFPFASHPEYGYKLAPFASEALASAGRVIAELGHRVTTHPGQFTQLGSPRPSVIENAIRDLDYHDEMFSLLSLPDQQNKDAVMILHMGGVFEGKAETVARFRENYARLSQSVKNRIVLENDDVCYTAHDLLPICEELNIPFVLDWHHHNILFDAEQCREGSQDMADIMPRILATWRRKGITPKMHYSEQTPAAITGRQRRKHNPRVWSLPPCPDDMDLMIEAKDKEQAVFELMRTFKLPGFNSFTDLTPYERRDDNKFADSVAGQRRIAKGETFDMVPEEEVGMGGPDGRVYWPVGMEEWLRPKKREVKPKVEDDVAKAEKAKAKSKAAAEKAYNERQAAIKAEATVGADGVNLEDPGEGSDEGLTPATKKAKAAMRKKADAAIAKANLKIEEAEAKAAVKVEAAEAQIPSESAAPRKKAAPKPKKTKAKIEQLTPSASDEAEEASSEEAEFEGDESEDGEPTPRKRPGLPQGRKSVRAGKARVSYVEEDEEMEGVVS